MSPRDNILRHGGWTGTHKRPKQGTENVRACMCRNGMPFAAAWLSCAYMDRSGEDERRASKKTFIEMLLQTILHGFLRSSRLLTCPRVFCKRACEQLEPLPAAPFSAPFQCSCACVSGIITRPFPCPSLSLAPASSSSLLFPSLLPWTSSTSRQDKQRARGGRVQLL